MHAISTAVKNLRTNRADRRAKDRGAVLVEAAICIPLLLLVILGAVEAGLAWEAKSSSVSGVRSGVLRAASDAGAADTDLRILQSVVGEVGADNVDRIDWVMVFEASDDAAAKFEACRASMGGPGCIIYQDSPHLDLVATGGTAAASFFDDGSGANRDDDADPDRVTSYSCTGSWDANWCAGQRTVGGDSQVGVAISYNHEWISGIFPFEAPTFTEFVVTSTFANGGTDVNGGGMAFAAEPNEIANFDGSAGFGNDAVSFDSSKVEEAPNGEIFLGRFAQGESVTATVEDQVAGAEVCVSFTLHVVGSWDDETFTVNVGGVTYTESYNYHDLRAAGGSANELGYSKNPHGKWNKNQNSTFPITVCNPNVIPDANGDVEIDFSSTLNQGVKDESWAIDDIVITTTAPTT